MAPECTRVNKRLVEKMAEKCREPYGSVMTNIRTKVRLALLRKHPCCKTFGKARGMLNLLDRSYADVAFSVISDLCTDVIIGQAFLKQHSSVIFEMQGPERAFVIPGSMPDLPGQVAVAAAKLHPPRLFEFLLPQYKPIACRCRRYNQEDTLFINNEMKRLLEADIIEPARSPWRAQVLVVNQERKKRLVVDYSATVNRFTLLDAKPLPNIADLVNNVSQDKYYCSLDLRSAYHEIPLLSEEKRYTAFEGGGKLFQYERFQARNQLGRPGGAKNFLRGAQVF